MCIASQHISYSVHLIARSDSRTEAQVRGSVYSGGGRVQYWRYIVEAET